MTDSNTTTADYSKLTVPQLKARCKELKLTGYSKLGKAALLEKLSQYGNTPIVAGTLTAISTQHTSRPMFPAWNDGTSSVVQNGASLPSAVTPATVGPPAPVPLAPGTGPILAEQNEKTGSKRLSDDSTKTTAASLRKKQKLGKKTVTNLPEQRTSSAVRPLYAPKGKFGFAGSVTSSSVSSSNVARQGRDTATNPSSKASNMTPIRFCPLVPRIRHGSRPSNSHLHEASENKMTIDHLLYLDFSLTQPLPPPSSFSPITIPPSLLQRKCVNAWSVILSGLSIAERKACALVSREIRYAVYLSAVPIIMREFGSRRLDQLSNRCSVSMTNFWPYLDQLRCDLLHKRRACETSLLGRFFDGFIPISSEIWGCPENDKQLTMALRFLLTRIWFIIMLDELDRNKAKNSIVVGAQEVVKDEIWSISIATRRKSFPTGFIQTFYVLESTCEVIGLPPVSGSQPSCVSDDSGLWQCQKRHLRGDWSDYVENRISNVNNPPLLNGIKWTNAEEYTKGISKLWLSKIAEEGTIGAYKKRVAERYVLACVVGNSISGQWMSSSLMAQVFAGTASGVEPGQTSLLRKREAQKVNLFLPEHHLVESVHFTTSGPKPRYLHRALAVVQTPWREYFILKDNGMEVGCEEDGVWPAWMELLGCNTRGIACS